MCGNNLEGISEDLEDGGVVYYHRIGFCDLTSFSKKPEDKISNVRCRLVRHGVTIKQYTEGIDYRVEIWPNRFNVLDFDPESTYGKFYPETFFLLEDLPSAVFNSLLEKTEFRELFEKTLDRQSEKGCPPAIWGRDLEINFEVH